MVKKSKADWVVSGGKADEQAHCTRCGEGLKINLPQPIPIVVAAMDAFVEMHRDCKAGTYKEPGPQSMHEWSHGRDTGTSSLTIYSAVTGTSVERMDVPHDPADFGRCYRLLKAFPEARKNLYRVVDICPQWKPLVDAWDELTALYEEELPTGIAPRLWNRLRQLMGKPPV